MWGVVYFAGQVKFNCAWPGRVNDNMNESISIVIDSRERRPYSFTLPTVVAGLKVGDYSLAGFEDRIAIERKTIGDLIACLSSGRKRFERELKRGRELDYFCLVVETDLKALTDGKYRSRMNPESVVQSLLAFSVRYRLPIFFVGGRKRGQQVTQGLLSKYAREIVQIHGKEQAADQLAVEELFILEPRLKDLREEVKAIRPSGPHFCANLIWYRKIKPKLLSMIGWDRGRDGPGADRLLSSSAAYDLIYESLYNELPDCRDCGCLHLEGASSSRNKKLKSSRGPARHRRLTGKQRTQKG